MTFRFWRITQIVECILALVMLGTMVANILMMNVDWAIVSVIVVFACIFHIEWCEKQIEETTDFED